MLLRDLGMAVVVSALAAVVIVLTVGRPETLHEQLVYSLCIGVPGYALVDLVRLRFWPELRGRPGPWLAMSGVMLATAPLAHWVGMHLGATVFGHRLPSLPDYPSQERISMILFTFIGFMLMTLMVEHRERLRRAERAHGEARLRAETIERQALQSQLQLLQAQIEPHMLFNTLANLQGLIALDPARANTMLDQLIQYLRATLGASRSASTTLEAEFAAMQAYLGLMGVRMGARLGYRLELPEDLRKLRVPPMLLQPLVENAIRHGLEPKIEGGEIRISAHAQGGMLELQVSDTGLGLARKPGSAGGGVGLATTRERLRVLYGGRASIELAPAQPHGALARLILPLETA
ncbi:Histidine kinase [Massilia yuzhufengensis]|uniref:Histidine kinase n=2 Tax=Massilia yuzhufengensis TaxID=1164594 RepID=A0A1I1N7N3_9BURK|nr:Histidine kinase [Massilia yuzhufengensis]